MHFNYLVILCLTPSPLPSEIRLSVLCFHTSRGAWFVNDVIVLVNAATEALATVAELDEHHPRHQKVEG